MKKFVLFLFCFIYSAVNAQSVQQIDNPIGVPVFGYKSIYVKRGDTIFSYKVYMTDTKIDSIIYSNKMVRQHGKKWIGLQDPLDSSYVVSNCIKMSKSKWFKDNNEKWFKADTECDIRAYKRYYPDGRIKKHWQFGSLSRTWMVKPKKEK